jgi:hypothetical protein
VPSPAFVRPPRRLIAGLLAACSLLTAALTDGVLAAPAPDGQSAHPSGTFSGRVNLAHLDHLRATVEPPPQEGHTTYRVARDPAVGVLWTYAEPDAGGDDYRRVGGGTYDPATDTYGQGAFNADDVSRAAVVYLRHWQRHGDTHSRDAAYALLRGLTYLQTVSGEDAGNVVLWMQPDGTLNPSAEPVEQPDPSDSGPSYWLARTVWALGEGYAAFRDEDPAFAAFLDARMSLALDALRRQVLESYGRFRVVDGRRAPAWLVADGADATAEAVLGLAAYVEADGGHGARQALVRLAEGVAAMGTPASERWPYGAVLPWAGSRSVWHGWGGMAPAALARAAEVTGDASLLGPALADTASFTSHLLAQGGPDNGWLPAPTDRSQIAYGADSRVQSLLTVAGAARRPGLRALAGFAASWYAGNNAAGARMYDPATGRTYDGVNGDGTVNRNSGAESTIHGLLSMLALEAAPDVAADAAVGTRVAHRTARLLEAESGTSEGGAHVVTPADAWTGESLWSGGAYVRLPRGGRLRLDADVPAGARVMPVVWRQDGHGRSRWTAGTGADASALGAVDHGDAGAQGVSPVPGHADLTTLAPPPGSGRRTSGLPTPGTGRSCSTPSSCSLPWSASFSGMTLAGGRCCAASRTTPAG